MKYENKYCILVYNLNNNDDDALNLLVTKTK